MRKNVEMTKEQSIIQQIDNALDVIGKLCNGEMEWVMSVPADEMRDPDLILAGALGAARGYISLCMPGRNAKDPMS